MPEQSKTVSLVLGAGGARGLAHIGVIQWLTENGYVIRSISGASMGALVGGIYAAGKLSTYAEWVLALERIDVLSLLDPAFGRNGLFKGERIIGLLRELIGDAEIRDLPMPYTAVAMDFDTGKEVWLREGKLFDAIRASMAIPLLLTPFSIGGRTLVDGGLVNPVPITPTLGDATDLTVAVNPGGRYETRQELRQEPPPSAPITDENDYRKRIQAFVDSLRINREPEASMPGMIDIALRSMEAMENTIARLKIAAYAPEVTIEIPRNACRIHEFWRAEEMIALGRERTARAFGANGFH